MDIPKKKVPLKRFTLSLSFHPQHISLMTTVVEMSVSLRNSVGYPLKGRNILFSPEKTPACVEQFMQKPPRSLQLATPNPRPFDDSITHWSNLSSLTLSTFFFLAGLVFLLRMPRLFNTGARPTMGGSLEHHPFSGQVHSAGELLHTHYRIHILI